MYPSRDNRTDLNLRLGSLIFDFVFCDTVLGHGCCYARSGPLRTLRDQCDGPKGPGTLGLLFSSIGLLVHL
ncbi:unnamed protein product [Parajaminaea phylloscopi]